MERPALSRLPLAKSAWALWFIPWLLLLVVAWGYDYRPAPAAADGESTYLMQAESLLHDGDFQFTRLDFDRHLLSRYGAPTDLRLATGSNGRELIYDHPFPYALWLTPFIAWRPATGFAMANLLLLGAVGWWVGRRLQGSVGPWAPAFVALLVFSSAVFAHAFFAGADLFLFSLTLVACALVRDREGSPTTPRQAMVAGALSAVLVCTYWLYGVVLLALLLSLPRRDRGALAVAAGLGCFLGSLALVMIQWWSGGGLGIFGTSRFKFTPETGFPTVDFSAAQWRENVAQLDALHWEGALKLAWGFDLELWLWNVGHLFVGQSFGILIYFLPVLPLMWLAAGEAPGRKGWWIAFSAWIALLLVFRPFDLSGGETVVANRLFLPLCAASILTWGRPKAFGPTRLVIAVLIPLVSSLFLWRLWTEPGAYPVAEGESYVYPTPVAKAVLPYEISQRTMPGGPVLDHIGLRVRLMDRGLGEDYLDRFSMAGDRAAKLWLASPEPLAALTLEMDDQGPSEILLAGADVRERVLLSDGGISFELEPRLFRRHAMWWSPREQYLYRLGFQCPEPLDRRIRFRLIGESADSATPEETP